MTDPLPLPVLDGWRCDFEPPDESATGVAVASDLTPALARLFEAFNVRFSEVAGGTPTLPSPTWTELEQVGTGVAASASLMESELWALHRQALGAWRAGEARPRQDGELGLLEAKQRLAYGLTSPCHACVFRCGVRRQGGERGRCGAGPVDEARLVDVLPVAGEEPFLSPTASIWWSGCPERCVGCLYTPAISARSGELFEPAALAASLHTLVRDAGVRSLMLVGGNPDVHLARCFDLLRAGPPPLPLVWNANGQSTPEALEILDGVVGTYLLDLKFFTTACARENRAERLALSDVAPAIEGAARQGVPTVVRVLARPGHVACCAQPLIRWTGELARRHENVFLHPMLGWLPTYDAARHPVQNRRLTPDERADVERTIAADPLLVSRRVGLRIEDTQTR